MSTTMIKHPCIAMTSWKKKVIAKAVTTKINFEIWCFLFKSTKKSYCVLNWNAREYKCDGFIRLIWSTVVHIIRLIIVYIEFYLLHFPLYISSFIWSDMNSYWYKKPLMLAPNAGRTFLKIAFLFLETTPRCKPVNKVLLSF